MLGFTVVKRLRVYNLALFQKPVRAMSNVRVLITASTGVAMSVKNAIRVAKLLAVVSLLTTVTWPQQQPQISNLDRGRALDMLQVIANDVKKHYYDPKFHGVDWDAQVADAKQKIAKATSFNMAMSHIAATLDALNDSHTFFLPPQHAYRHNYGLQYQIIGNRCFVTKVRPASDAEAKEIKPGDEILGINGYNVTRDDLWKLQYLFSVLRPQPALRLTLQDPSGGQRQVDVSAKINETKRVTDLTGANGANDIWDLVRQEEAQEHLMRARSVEYGDQLTVLKVPEFYFSAGEVEGMISKARKHPNLIVDLRGNPGGAIDTLKYLVGAVFDKEVKIADRVGRKETKPEIAKPLHNPYLGKLVVLVDARSASAAELFARVMQLEKRGVVIGDQTSGAVMEARHYDERSGTDTVVYYGASITEWDLIMADGKSLEHAGVTPDELLLPSAHALANGRDPVLAHAAETFGIKITGEEAGKAFPYEWPPEN
ncbi:MAG TPA: S41 family peptidase [Candidatus Sulfotelmatobacter sp.]|nr:S41 family peptidase [Candidatus Sulfotelmatobacter sp.]